jgi:hypothetical protein
MTALSAPLATTWVHGNHTSKIGAEWRLASWTDRNSRGAQGIYNFSANETADPYNNTATVNGNGIAGSTGNGYASFLLGQVDTATVNTVQDPQLRRQAWGPLSRTPGKSLTGSRSTTVCVGIYKAGATRYTTAGLSSDRTYPIR